MYSLWIKLSKGVSLDIHCTVMEKKYNILYVDDEQQNLLAFRAVFRRFFNVYTVNGGEEAISFLEQQDIDLVVSDQRMPAMTGLELCEHVMAKYPALARIIVTGYSETEPLDRAVEEGKIRSFVLKPWDTQNLKVVMEQAINQ